MTSPLLPFSGGLRAQSDYIISALHHFCGANDLPYKLCDPFFGGGSISYTAMMRGFTVSSSDIALRSVIPAAALIEERQEMKVDIVKRMTQLSSNASTWDFEGREEVEKVLDPRAVTFGRSMLKNATNCTEKYLALRVLLDIVPMGGFGLMKRTETSDGALEAAAKCHTKMNNTEKCVDKWRRVINEGLAALPEGGEGTAGQLDANDALKRCGTDGYSVAHLDPPTYGTKGYTNLYWWLDAILGDEIIKQDAGFTKAEALGFVEGCLEKATGIPIVAITQQDVSYKLSLAREVLEASGRTVSAYQVPVAHTSNPFYIAIGVK